MTQATTTYATWHPIAGADARMGDSHAPLWRHFIETAAPQDLRTRTVMDFGCNRGGFLRMLHALRPFQQGVGVDIAVDSVAAANDLRGVAPISYHVATDLAPWADAIDLAFSYEVIYLLPSLQRHAEEMFRALRPGATYCAVTGCHTESPLWPRWKDLLQANSNAPVQDYSPDDFASAFSAAGFEVSLRRFGYDGFVPASKDRSYYPSLMDALAYPSEYKLLFRMTKQA